MQVNLLRTSHFCLKGEFAKKKKRKKERKKKKKKKKKKKGILVILEQGWRQDKQNG